MNATGGGGKRVNGAFCLDLGDRIVDCTRIHVRMSQLHTLHMHCSGQVCHGHPFVQPFVRPVVSLQEPKPCFPRSLDTDALARTALSA